MADIGSRLRTLREGIKLSQAKLGDILGLKQTSINRYENNNAEAPYRVLLWYADYFDVSLDYIFGRTDKPQGQLYEYKPKLANSKEMEQFIEMCFDPNSTMNGRLRDMLLQMMQGGE